MFKLLKQRHKKTTPPEFEFDAEQRSPAPTHDVEFVKVDDLVRALWNGFSRHAIADLAGIADDTKRTGIDRGTAQYNLARWYATAGEWAGVRRYLRGLEKNAPELFQSKRAQLLLAEAAIHLTDPELNRKQIETALANQFDSDYCLASANLNAAAKNDSDGREGLAALNAIYREFGISQIATRPGNDGFLLKRLSPDVDGFRFRGGPLISVLMSVSDDAHVLPVAIQSILAQTYENIALIVVDDASQDQSYDILSSFAQRDNRVRIFKNTDRQGKYPSRNHALDNATGELITVHDANEWSHPCKLEMQLGAMMCQPRYKAVFCSSATVTDEMRFVLQWQQSTPQYIQRHTPSMLIRRKDFQQLTYWDNVLANADTELIQRAQLLWQDDFALDVSPGAPLSLCTAPHPSSLEATAASLNRHTIGSSQEYARQGNHWRQTIGIAKESGFKRTSQKKPFPIPSDICPAIWRASSDYDLVIISDLSLPDDTEISNEGYVRAAMDNGLHVGLFHWPRYDYEPSPIADVFTELSRQENVDFLVPEDSVSTALLLIHHPPVLKYEIDAVPQIEANQLAILVDEAPMELWEEPPYFFDDDDVSALCQKLFDSPPLWIAVSPRIHRILFETGKFSNILPEPWFPPSPMAIPASVPAPPADFGTDRAIVAGRLSRDHWQQWPADPEELAAAYLVNQSNITLRFMGGLDTPHKILGARPSNWETVDFDVASLSAYIDSLDFYIQFINEDYIEGFGQPIVNAMARGRVVLLPPDFREIFEDAAVYCAPSEVKNRVETYWNDPALYRAQVARGFEFVNANCAPSIVFDRLSKLIDATSKRDDRPITPVS